MVSLYLLFYFIGRNPLLDVRIIDILLLTIFIFFSIKEFRDRYNSGQLHFWQGVSIGFMTYITIAIISAISILILIQIDPELLQNYIESRVAFIKANDATLIEEIDEQAYIDALEGVKKTTALDLVLDDFLKKSIIGLFLTIIIAIILRK